MDAIQVYLDETYGHKKNFFITTSIWGHPFQIEKFEKEVEKIVQKHQNDLGKYFKVFHANRLNTKNWDKLSPAFLEVLKLLFKGIYNRELGALLFLESRKKRDNNATILKILLKKGLNDRSNDLGKQYQHVDRRDLPALYHRMDNIYNFLIHRDKFGGPNQEFQYFPDSKGKILRYKNKKIPLYRVSSMIGERIMYYDFYEVISMLANPMMNFAEQVLGWNKPDGQKITKYEPLSDEDSRVIQACDILTNFFLSFLRMKLNVNDKNASLKGKWLEDQEVFKNTESIFLNYFEERNNFIFCKNDDLKHYMGFVKAG